jgi:putative Holliday junction resolvase
MRMLGVDAGLRRIGLAVSDDSATLARPWQTIAAGATPGASADRIASAVDHETRQTLGDFVIGGVVVGWPRRLDGRETHATAAAVALADALSARLGIPVHLQDERLTSREADAMLATREPDWRARKRLVDAAAAALLLQDYLDARAEVGSAAPRGDQ